MDKRIGGMSGHEVVAGIGRVGTIAGEEYEARGLDFVVIDKDDEALGRARERGWAWVRGDATEDDTLRAAGIERARSLTAALDNDVANVFVTLTARGLNPGLFIVARASTQTAGEKLKRSGADRVITPTEMGGRRMAAMVVRPMVADFLDIVTRGEGIDLKLEQIELALGDPWAGRTIVDARIHADTGVYVLAVRGADGSVDTNPAPETVMRVGDRLVVLGTPEQIKSLAARSGGSPGLC
jgi:voltage-gated potassium channel